MGLYVRIVSLKHSLVSVHTQMLQIEALVAMYLRTINPLSDSTVQTSCPDEKIAWSKLLILHTVWLSPTSLVYYRHAKYTALVYI